MITFRNPTVIESCGSTYGAGSAASVVRHVASHTTAAATTRAAVVSDSPSADVIRRAAIFGHTSGTPSPVTSWHAPVFVSRRMHEIRNFTFDASGARTIGP